MTISVTSTSKQQLAAEIKAFIDKIGGTYSEWYVGIAKAPDDRLFNDHIVNEATDNWVCGKAQSNQEAREVEKYFVETLGTDGGTGGGGPNTKYVYAYQKNSHTEP